MKSDLILKGLSSTVQKIIEDIRKIIEQRDTNTQSDLKLKIEFTPTEFCCDHTKQCF